MPGQCSVDKGTIMKLTGAQMICEGMVKEGVEVIFGILGGSILPLYDALSQYPRLRPGLVLVLLHIPEPTRPD